MRCSMIVLIFAATLGVQGQLANLDNDVFGVQGQLATRDEDYDDQFDDDYDNDWDVNDVLDDDDYRVFTQCRETCSDLIPTVAGCYARHGADDVQGYTNCLCNSRQTPALISRCQACIAQHGDDDDNDDLRDFFSVCSQGTTTTASAPTSTTTGGGSATTSAVIIEDDFDDDPDDNDFDFDDFVNTTDDSANNSGNNGNSPPNAGSAFQLPSMGVLAVAMLAAAVAL